MGLKHLRKHIFIELPLKPAISKLFDELVKLGNNIAKFDPLNH